MRVGTRRIGAIGAALALGGAALGLIPGAAGAQAPSATSDHLSVRALLFQSTTNNRFHIVATSCRLTSVDEGTPVSCFLFARGTRTSAGGYNAVVRVASVDGTVDASFALCGCGSGSGAGVERDEAGPAPVTLFGFLTSATTLDGTPVTDPMHLPNIERIAFELNVNDAVNIGAARR